MRSFIFLLLVCSLRLFHSSISQRVLQNKDFIGLGFVSLDFTPQIAGNASQIQIIVIVNSCISCTNIDVGDTITLYLPGFSRGSDASMDTSQSDSSDGNGLALSRFNISSWTEVSTELILTCTGTVLQGTKALVSVPIAAGIKLPKLGLRRNQVRSMNEFEVSANTDSHFGPKFRRTSSIQHPSMMVYYVQSTPPRRSASSSFLRSPSNPRSLAMLRFSGLSSARECLSPPPTYSP